MFPYDGRRDPYLCTYYAAASLLVVALAITLIWCPFVQMITEANTFITRLVIYMNTEILGITNIKFFDAIETLFLSERTLVSITAFCVSYALYLASGDFLQFASCYFANLPNTETFYKVKKYALEIIDDLINLTGKRKIPKFNPSHGKKLKYT